VILRQFVVMSFAGGIKALSLESSAAIAAWHAKCFCIAGVTPESTKKMSRSNHQNRIPPLDPKGVVGKTKQIFDEMQARLGMVPNLFRVLGNAPAALEAYVNFGGALAAGKLDRKVQEQIGLAVAESNLCDYCLSAHVFMGSNAGLTESEISDAIRARAADAQADAILKLARSVIIQRGELSDCELERGRDAGLTNGEIVEIVANVVLNIFMNYLDHVARPVVDFPDVNCAK
jgi:AhpD family alkylhydroperoxidase